MGTAAARGVEIKPITASVGIATFADRLAHCAWPFKSKKIVIKLPLRRRNRQGRRREYHKQHEKERPVESSNFDAARHRRHIYETNRFWWCSCNDDPPSFLPTSKLKLTEETFCFGKKIT